MCYVQTSKSKPVKIQIGLAGHSKFLTVHLFDIPGINEQFKKKTKENK